MIRTRDSDRSSQRSGVGLGEARVFDVQRAAEHAENLKGHWRRQAGGSEGELGLLTGE